ncbi:hypothetical protein GQ54DRAFT_308349, partial [Martensiomyces pterosporus]
MFHLDLNFASNRAVDSDEESDIEVSEDGECSLWAALDRRILQRITGFVARQRDRRSFCLVNRDWALAGESHLWAYPEFATPQQLASFLRIVADKPGIYAPRIRGIRFTLGSHYDHHLATTGYFGGVARDSGLELPTLLEIAQGRHVLSPDPAILRTLLHGSDLTSPALALKFARMCSPIDSLSLYGFRLRDKHIVNDLMRWNLRELEIIGTPRKPLSNLSYLLYNLRSLRSLRIESDTPLPADAWGPLAIRLSGLHKLRIWAPNIAGAQLSRALNRPPTGLITLHLIGPGNDLEDEFVERIVQASPNMRSLAVYSTRVTGRSAEVALGVCANLTHLEVVRDDPQPSSAESSSPHVVASHLSTLALRNIAIGDALIESAATTATSLRALHISGSPNLTGDPVAALLNASTSLASLGLSNCPRLSEKALLGLAQGPSAQTLQVLIVDQCGMQSDGVEYALPALVNLKHLTVAGTEVVHQRFQYAYNSTAAAAAADGEAEETEDREATDHGELVTQQLSPLAVDRQFEPVYPKGHYFRQSEPQAADEEQEEQEVVKEAPKPVWRDSLASGFIPGLLAFASKPATAEEASRVGRRRATVSSDDHLAAAGAEDADGSRDVGIAQDDGDQPARRVRSVSEQPANVEPIIVHDGSDLSPSPKSVHGFASSPMEREDIGEAIERSIVATAPAEEPSVSDKSSMGLAAAAAAAVAATVAVVVANEAPSAEAGGDATEEQPFEEHAPEPADEPADEPVAEAADGAGAKTEEAAVEEPAAQPSADLATDGASEVDRSIGEVSQGLVADQTDVAAAEQPVETPGDTPANEQSSGDGAEPAEHPTGAPANDQPDSVDTESAERPPGDLASDGADDALDRSVSECAQEQVEDQTDSTTAEPAGEPAEQPVEPSDEAPVDEESNVAAAQPVEVPSASPAAGSEEVPPDQPSKEPANAQPGSVEVETAEQLADDLAVEDQDPAAVAATGVPVQPAAEQSTEFPSEDPVSDQPADESSEPGGEHTEESIEEPTGERAEDLEDTGAVESADEKPVESAVDEQAPESASISVKQPSEAPVTDQSDIA